MPLSDNLRGSLFMIASMAGFAVEDLLLKTATHSLPVGQVLILFGLGGTLIFAALTWRRGERIVHPAILSKPILLRAISEVAGRLFYTLAIAMIPLSTASAILQAAPLVVIAGAALIFGEKVGLRRWLAVVVGFAGVLLILRPGLAGFSLTALLAVAGMAGFAGRDLATRAAPPVLSNMQLGVYGFAMLIPAGALLLGFSGGATLPASPTLGLIGGATLFGVAAYNALTVAMRTGEVSAVTPFRYTRLVFALILGVFVLGEQPDAATLMGSVIVVVSGLYALFRGARRLSAA